ncbi:hypothetical protein JAAARDRAFT_49387 [Jaapia argillacea MUCL 33604]|uniref:Peptidase S1 domain-containing protein n=1 Tax=Jaapia argillacea MUCL 33604 TaxID=933084 RepID=A0A067PHS7_9AGAM|nr:hypothetical protein JAAARDRAFT_49387 [Jaapia argillacea MUCL 33604]
MALSRNNLTGSPSSQYISAFSLTFGMDTSNRSVVALESLAGVSHCVPVSNEPVLKKDFSPGLKPSRMISTSSNPSTNAPYVTPDIEARNYYYGLPSKPRLIARSSPDVWRRPTGPEAYLIPKELTPLGTHRLNEVWEKTVGPAMDQYLQGKGVQSTSMNPLRIGIAGDSSPPAVIFVGVNPGSLSHELGLEVAVHCRSILVQNGIDDVHIEIRESKFTRAAMLYKPDISFKVNAATAVRESFSTALGLPICNANTTNFEGTGGFFFIDPVKPGILYLLTARHVLFPPGTEQNKLYEFHGDTGAPLRNVMLLGEAAFKARLKDLEAAIRINKITVDQLNRHLVLVDNMEDEDEATAERNAVTHKIDTVIEVIEALETLLPELLRDWQKEENRIIGHVVLSPPIGLDDGDDGFADDWAVVEIHPTKISRLNFVGNAIDLSYIPIIDLVAWMLPHTAGPSSFQYLGDALLECSGTVSDQEMFRPDLKNKDHHDDPALFVLKHGNASKLTAGRLNTICAFVREYVDGVAGEMSKELSVLPRSLKSGSFSAPGDSGSVVIDGVSRICGIIVGGDGDGEDYDCTFVTSINFLVKRLAAFGIEANIFPLPTDL